MADSRRDKGISLAKGPVGVIGLLALIYGITALIFGGHSFATQPLDGTVTGKTWLGLEVNAWSSLLFIGAGALLLFGAPLHWGAKSLSLIVGLALGAASVIALVDGDDVFGIFAANGLSALVWGVAAAVLLILALVPRVGGKNTADDDQADPPRESRRVERESRRAQTGASDRAAHANGTHGAGSRMTPAAAGTPTSGGTTPRRRGRRRCRPRSSPGGPPRLRARTRAAWRARDGGRRG